MFGLIASAIGGASMKSALISGAASLVGGALSRKQAKKERASHFANLRNSAIAGGFNPLTALYATGGGGYGNYAAALSRSPMEGALSSAANSYNQGQANQTMMAHEMSIEKMRQSHSAKLTRMQADALKASIPTVQENVTQATGNQDLAKDGSGDVTSDVQFTPTETWVDSRGVTRTKTTGEDFDEQVLNSVYHAGDHLFYGMKDLYGYITRGEDPRGEVRLNPDLPVLQPWGAQQPAALTRERKFSTQVTIPPTMEMDDLPSHWRNNTLRLW